MQTENCQNSATSPCNYSKIYTLSHAWNILTNVDNIIQGIILSQNLNNEKLKNKTHTTHSIWIIPDRVLIEHYLFQINDAVIPPNEL